MKLYKTTKGNILNHKNPSFINDEEWDKLINKRYFYSYLLYSSSISKELNNEAFNEIILHNTLPRIGSQELW